MGEEPRAALVVDVDGVVSPVHGRTDWGDDVVAGRVFGTVYVSPEMCRRLDQLATLPDVCAIWLTDWDAEMRATMDPFPGRDWTAIERPWDERDAAQETGRWWKAAALLNWLDTHSRIRTLVWADDHLAKPHDRLLPAEEVSFGATTRAVALTRLFNDRGIANHMIAPDTTVGLTRAQLHRIEGALGVR